MTIRTILIVVSAVHVVTIVTQLRERTALLTKLTQTNRNKKLSLQNQHYQKAFIETKIINKEKKPNAASLFALFNNNKKKIVYQCNINK